LKAGDDFGNVSLELLERRAGDRKCDAKFPFVSADNFQHQLIGGHITMLGDFSADLAVFVVVEIMLIGIEDAVTPQAVRLMNLKVKADRGHEASILRACRVTGKRQQSIMVPWSLPDDKLLSQCRFEAFVGSGPGGQKRHKTKAAVRLTHRPTGVSAVAAESRSQRENRIHALRRLRHKLALQSPRTPIDLIDFQPPAWLDEYLKLGLHMSPKNPVYSRTIVVVLDLLRSAHWEPFRAAPSLGISTSALTRFLAADPPLWTQVNAIRMEIGLPPLVRR
jgi:hypothetical protein